MRDPNAWIRPIATWFGCGLSPIAPGTVGAIGALPLHLLLRRTHPALHWAGIVATTAVGTWAADRFAERVGEDDPQQVVVDEVAGALIALGLVARRSRKAQLLALLLFRALDITKPGPIDRLQHTSPPGLGIMADDLLAGVIAGLIARCLTRPS